ncbi:MAG: RsmB/NOP family class I SAM-dependent RNA methyltransferase [Rhizobiaceae bacterium]|nr:RsmB/NOP family class I SAM-dependent RNA methyltransferase [Rhizobiaceae bacterium]
MRIGGRLAAAIEVLQDMEQRHRPVADALKDWGLSHRFAGSGDRAAVGNIVYGALRRRRTASWLLDADTPRAHAYGALLTEWELSFEALGRELEGDRFAPAPLSPAEQSCLTQRLGQTPPDDVRADCPDWCLPQLESAFGADWADEAAALATRPPLDLRVNTLLSSREKVSLELEETGAMPTLLAPNGLRIAPIQGAGRHPNVQAEPAFQQGWFEVQDEGSQVVAALAGAGMGMQVLDYCAGAGGKTLALAAAMENGGRIHAFDAEKARLAPIFDRLRRSGATNVEVVGREKSLAPLSGQMDIVLVDAPCTGSGTWRRRPDAKWRLSPKQVEARTAEQTAILDKARTYVRPGGLLVYITCSVFRDENAAQVEAFLARDGGFSPVDHGDLWRSHHPGREDAARIDRRLGISLTPARSGTDGFYFAALRRES